MKYLDLPSTIKSLTVVIMRLKKKDEAELHYLSKLLAVLCKELIEVNK